MLSFLFLFTCMLFVLFMRVKSSCKKKIKRFKITLIPSFTIIMTCNPLNLPIESYLFNLFFFIRIFFHYHNLFSLTQSYFIITIFFITIFFNYHNLFQLSQSFSIITIFFHYHNLFQLSQSFLSQSFFHFFYNLYIENLFVRTYFCL